MARKLKFSLNHNNQPLRTLDDLRKDCDLNQLLIDYREGKLKRWLDTFRTFDNLIQAMDNSIVFVLDKKSSQNDLEVTKELVEILGIETKILEDYQQKIDNSRKLFDSGNNYYDLKEYEKALADYNKAIELDPNYTEAINRRDTTIDIIAEIRKAEEEAKREAEEEKNRLITPKADFTQLNQYLAEGKWKEADQETANIMLKIMGRESEGWLTVDNCKNFPRKELKIIDQLWLKYSNDKFGFSVQKQIWLDLGGKIGEYDYHTYEKFADRIGWRKNNEWLSYSELIYDKNTALQGHLPLPGGFWWGVGGGVQSGWAGTLFSSLDSNT